MDFNESCSGINKRNDYLLINRFKQNRSRFILKYIVFCIILTKYVKKTSYLPVSLQSVMYQTDKGWEITGG